MTIAPAIGAVAAALLLLPTAREAGAQAIPEPTVAFRQAQWVHVARPDSAPPARKTPSNTRLNLVSIASGAGGAIVGAGTGLAMDDRKCRREHAGTTSTTLFGPCFVPAGMWTERGWYAGGMIGATLSASAIARERGCPWKSATLRAIAGAAAGSIPALIVARDAKATDDSQAELFVVSAPLLAGVGAALAVTDCVGK